MTKLEQLKKDFYEQAHFQISDTKIFDLAEKINQNRLPSVKELRQEYQRHAKPKYQTIDGLYISIREYKELHDKQGLVRSVPVYNKLCKRFGRLPTKEELENHIYGVDKA